MRQRLVPTFLCVLPFVMGQAHGPADARAEKACAGKAANSIVAFPKNWCEEPGNPDCAFEIKDLVVRPDGSRVVQPPNCDGVSLGASDETCRGPEFKVISAGCQDDEIRSIALCKVGDYSIELYDHGHGALGKDHAFVKIGRKAGERNLCLGTFNSDWTHDSKLVNVDFQDADAGDGQEVDGKVSLIKFWHK